MKRVRADDEAITFQLSPRERDTLLQLLQAYPCVPPAHHRASKKENDRRAPEFQRLLDAALAEQRAGNQRHLQEWLAAPERFKKTKGGFGFTLERNDCEWLLQVLNDVRVGYWLRLGSPDPGVLKPQSLDGELLLVWVTMEMSGYFQMFILEAMES